MGNPDHNNPLSWRSSSVPGGAPGTSDGILFTGDANADTDQDGLNDLVDFAIGAGSPPTATLTGTAAAPILWFTMDRDIAVQVSSGIQISSDLTAAGPAGWIPASNAILISRTPLTGTVERLTFAIPAPPGATRAFVRARFSNP
jgi:hypothetical protein